MKKLFAVLFVLLLASGAMARGSLEVWAGGTFSDMQDPTTWDSIMVVSPDKWVEIPIYMRGTDDSVFLADINWSLGCHIPYVDTLDGLNIFRPFAGWDPAYNFKFNWDVAQFANYNDEFSTNPTPMGWVSYSFMGFCRPSFIESAWFPDWPGAGLADDPSLPFPNIVKSYSFNIHTNADTLLIGDTVCYAGDTLLDAIGPGHDFVVGPANAGDTLGGPGYALIQHFACLYYSPNQPPIIDPDDTFAMPYYCGYTDFTVTIDIFDNDGDALTVTVNYGTITGFVVVYGGPGEPTLYRYTIDFDMDDFCSNCWVFDLVFTADDGVNDPVTRAYYGPFTIIGAITVSLGGSEGPCHPVWVLPGEEGWMGIYLDPCGSCFCLGGFVFTICYDPSVLTATDVVRGVQILTGEYWNVTFDVIGDYGAVHFVFINDLNDQEEAPLICDIDKDDPLIWVKFLLAPLEYPDQFCIPICFCPDFGGEPGGYDYEANNVTDAEGYHTWLPIPCEEIPPDSVVYGIMCLKLVCCNVKIVDCNTIRGDINLNGFPWEAGDAVLLANHLISAVAYPFTLRQMVAADVNQDGYRATIADLIFLINKLNEFDFGPKLAPLDVVATVSMPEDATGDVNVMINSDASVGGALVAINHTGVELGEPVVNGMDLSYSDNGDVMTVLVYDMDAASFAPGSNVLFTVPVLSEGEITFGDVSVSDNRGALLDARAELSAPIPTEFTVSQNFPNPFNATTRINFAVPKAADVNIAIYNVAGQLVERMDLGKMAPGYQSIIWDASSVASGVYFYKVTAGDKSMTKKMTLLK